MAATVWLYEVLTVPSGRLVVVITRSAGSTVIESAWVSVSGVPWSSVTSTVKLAVSAVVGVPVIAPVEELSDSPLGRAPEYTDHV